MAPPASHAELDLLRQSAQDAPPFVLPALTPAQYLTRIAQARPQAWQQLGDLVEGGFFKRAAEDLVLFPFDDVAQSAYYLPWAMLSVDEARAVKVGALLAHREAP